VELVKGAWGLRGQDNEQAREALDAVWRYYDVPNNGQSWDVRSLHAFMEVPSDHVHDK
jgi:hypothetical protein